MVFLQISFLLQFRYPILISIILSLILTSHSQFLDSNPIFKFGILFSILGSKMSPSVMYGSASLFALSYLGLSRGIVLHIYILVIYVECTMIHNTHLQVP